MNEEYINGILYKMAPQYLGDHSTTVHEVFKYLEDKGYDKVHQLAEYMAKEVVFFFPIMEEYLKKYCISYNTYIKGVYHGTIWADQYMIGALSKMFNIKITVISPYYADVWNVFHKSTFPNVVIVSNGGDFGTQSAVTHFTATCGSENVWQCVSRDVSVGELGHHYRESDGRACAINVFEATEKRKMFARRQRATWQPLVFGRFRAGI